MDFGGETDLKHSSIEIKTENDYLYEENDNLSSALDSKQGIQRPRSISNCVNTWSSGEDSDQEGVNSCIVKIEEEVVQLNTVTPYTCEMCNATYDGLASYEVHLEHIHGLDIKHKHNEKKNEHNTVEKPYKSDQCSASFTAKGSLKRHKILHAEESPYKCDICNASFGSKDNLTRHEVIHAEKNPYKCDKCTLSFNQKGHLKIHMFLRHKEEKPHKCDECSSAFARKDDCKRHRLVVHLGGKPYMCEICSSSFVRKGELKKHKVQMHAGVRPYEYFNPTSLTGNMNLMSSNVHAYKCDKCSSIFKTKIALRSRNGEKPHQCHKCYSSSFARKLQLKFHRLTQGKCD